MKRLASVLLFLAVGVLMLHDHMARMQTYDVPVLQAKTHVPSAAAIGSVHELLHAYLLPQAQEWRMAPIALAGHPSDAAELYDTLNTAPPLHPPAH
ncbi:MAG: hypothetical protein JXK05_06120 [Campylobacterales bacterium]|nr:hypothetical protein [Campylobacterales bacterium]